MFSLSYLFSAISVYANSAAEGAAEGAGAGGMLGGLLMPIVLIAVFYFMLIMPQRKKDKKVKEMIAALKITDEIVTIGGIHGKIIRIKDETVVLETGAGTQKSFVRVERSAINRLVKEGAGKGNESTPIFDSEEDNDIQ